jgi:hypothetical protein
MRSSLNWPVPANESLFAELFPLRAERKLLSVLHSSSSVVVPKPLNEGVLCILGLKCTVA